MSNYPTGNELPNLVNVTKRLDPDGSIAKISELLAESNPILDDIPIIEGNMPMGHLTTVRTGLPEPTWRRLNYGVYPTKSQTAQITESCAMLEAYAEVDKRLAEINGNTAEWRASEDKPHIESMSQTMVDTLIYGDTAIYPDRFLGLAPRYDSLTLTGKPTAVTNSAYLNHVISCSDGTPTADKQTSVWYIVWGEETVHGIYPKGSKAGLEAEDLGRVTLQDNDGGRFEGYRSHYKWEMGLVVRDWRYIVRICNIELADMEAEASQQLLYHAMIKAMHTTPGGNGIFYASPGVLAMLDIAAVEKGNAALGYSEIFGKPVLTFRGRPIRKVNAILETEAVIS